jgi:hypothetical protein
MSIKQRTQRMCEIEQQSRLTKSLAVPATPTSSSAKADDPVRRALSAYLSVTEYWMPAFAGMTALA